MLTILDHSHSGNKKNAIYAIGSLNSKNAIYANLHIAKQKPPPRDSLLAYIAFLNIVEIAKSTRMCKSSSTCVYCKMATTSQLWFEAYCAQRPGELRQSSRNVYGAWWSKFSSFLAEEGIELHEATAPAASRFLHRYATNTAIRYYRLLSAVYDTAVERGACRVNPLLSLQSEFDREEATVPAPAPGAASVAALYSLCPTGSWKKHRDYLLVLLAAESGLRSHELLTLTLDQLHLESVPPYLVVGRPLQARKIELPLIAVDKVRAWLELRAKVGAQGDLVFPTDLQGTPLHPSTAYRIIAKKLDQVGAGKAILGASGAQVLRSGFAQRGKAQGLALPDIQGKLGHRQMLSTVELLARVSSPDR